MFRILSTLTISCALFLSACSYDPTVDIAHAGSFDSIKNIQQYLDKGVGVNAPDETGDTALHNAATFGHINNVKFLLAKGANIHLKNDAGETPLGTVGAFGKENHAAIIKLLLAKGANINAQNNEGDTVLSSAVILGNIANVKLLIDSGANIHLKNKEGDTAYEYVCGLESEKAQAILKLFEAKGAKCR